MEKSCENAAAVVLMAAVEIMLSHIDQGRNGSEVQYLNPVGAIQSS